MNSDIQAVDKGEVMEIGFDPEGFGEYFKIRHQWGESLYAHLSRKSVLSGDKVQKGQSIAKSGNSGNSSGPHLHFGIRYHLSVRVSQWGDSIPHGKLLFSRV